MKLYAYTNQYEKIIKEGYKSLFLIDKTSDVYQQRMKTHASQAHSENIKDIETYLEKTFKGRLRSVSVLTESAPRKKYKHPYLNRVANDATLISFDLDRLIKDKIVEAIYCKENLKYLTTDVNKEYIYKVTPDTIDITPIDWEITGEHIKNSPWSCIRHYMLVLKKGVIPPKYIHLEYLSKKKPPIQVIAFDAGWVLFRPGNWEILHKYGFTDEEGYWLLREPFGRAKDWILYQIKKGKTNKQIIQTLLQYYPKYASLLKRTQPILKDIVPMEFNKNIKLAQYLNKGWHKIEVWSDNGLGGPKKKKYKDSDIGMIPDLPKNSPLYKQYPSVHTNYDFPAVYSKDIGVLKENPKFFIKAMQKHKDLKPEQFLFIEDREQNLESAKSLGIRCIQFVARTNNRQKVPGIRQVHTTQQLKKEIYKLIEE